MFHYQMNWFCAFEMDWSNNCCRETNVHCLMQYEWPTYCISLINIHRAGNRGEAFIAFWCLRCCSRANTVRRKWSSITLNHHLWYYKRLFVLLIYINTFGLQWQYSKVDSTEHTRKKNKNTCPQMSFRDFPCSSCVAAHRVWLGYPDNHRKNLCRHISCSITSTGYLTQVENTITVIGRF